MYCQSCGNELTVELKYCNRCGANLSLAPITYPAPIGPPIKLTLPAIVLGLTITGGLGIIISGATELAQRGVHPAALTWMVIFSMATLFGCTALTLRFWLKLFTLSRETYQPPSTSVPHQVRMPALPQQQLPPRLEPMPSVTEHTTRTFSRAYRESSDPGSK